MEVLLCERVNDLRYSLNCVITTAFELWEKPKVTGSKVWTIGRLRNCLDAHLGKIVCDKDGVVDWCTVLVEMPLTRFEECWPLPKESLPELPSNHNIVFLVDCLSSGNPVYVDHDSFVKKKGSSKVCGWICSVWPSWSGRASMLPLGTLSLGLWVIAVDPAFIAGHQSIKNCGI